MPCCPTAPKPPIHTAPEIADTSREFRYTLPKKTHCADCELLAAKLATAQANFNLAIELAEKSLKLAERK